LLELGPEFVVVKKGEHGALMLHGDSAFVSAALPLEEVFDPTGAGDAFAGGVIGSLAAAGEITNATMRRAIAYGTVVASATVERFGVDGLVGLDAAEIEARYLQLRHLTHFEPSDVLLR
jgi:sugar/nucleoside kinase (ribokinase family)